ncbi:MAG: hypothetical protein HYX78_02625 [Armatimonadetes bacterium]|nr:hypothetical protein [Armatimonadota bacterium]
MSQVNVCRLAAGMLLAMLVAWPISSAHAGRLIATPYAETLPAGKASLWQFALHESRTTDNWRTLNRLDIGLSDRVELGIFVINPRDGRTDTWVNLQYRLNKETKGMPVMSIGVWDAARIDKFSGRRTGGSFFVATGKTLKPTLGQLTPEYLKLSLAAGTNRLNGLFGGIDLRFTKETGVFVEYAPTNIRLPKSKSVDVGLYHWLTPQWRARASWMGGNPMLDVFYTWTISSSRFQSSSRG